jgi:hypothetical protein
MSNIYFQYPNLFSKTCLCYLKPTRKGNEIIHIIANSTKQIIRFYFNNILSRPRLRVAFVSALVNADRGARS